MYNFDSNKIINTLKGTKILVLVSVLVLSSLPFYLDIAINHAGAQSSDSTNNNGDIIMHFHVRLNVTVDGEPIPIPAEIGIEPSLWKYHDLDAYGMQPMNMTMPAMAPLYTLDNSGNITIGSSINREYTLGEFFKIWGIDLEGKSVKVIVDGKPISDFRNYILNKDDNNSLNISINGKPIPVPAKVGIEPSLWKYHDLDAYGMQPMNMTMGGMAPLHTHDNSGTIHVETSINREYTLGEFLDVWGGLNLNDKQVNAMVDGQAVSDFRNHILKDNEKINLEISR